MSSTREMSFATTGEIEAAKKRRLEADIKERDKEAQIAKTNLEGWKTSYYQKQAENEQKATEKAAEKETNSGLGISRKRPRTVEFGDDQKSWYAGKRHKSKSRSKKRKHKKRHQTRKHKK